MRKKLYAILDVQDDSSPSSKIYNVVNIVMILLSILPLMFKEERQTLIQLEQIAVVFFIVEYFLRWLTADIKFSDKSDAQAFLMYPFTPMAVVDLLSILPSLTFLDGTLRLLRILRLSRSLRVFRAFKIFRYSKSMELLIRTFEKQKDSLLLVGGMIVAYILIASLLVFNVEQGTFPTYFDAVVWATTSLTTITYIEYFPTTVVGQIIAMLSYLVGVVIIALPTSIITAGYVEELNEDKDIKNSQNNDTEDQ